MVIVSALWWWLDSDVIRCHPKNMQHHESLLMTSISKTKVTLRHQYVVYLSKTKTIVSAILLLVEWANIHLYGTIIMEVTLFISVFVHKLHRIANRVGQLENT